MIWVDIKAGLVHRWTEGAEVAESFDPGCTVSAIALAEAGGFIAATDRGFAGLSLSQDQARVTFTAGGLQPSAGARMNDGACDRVGRFWAGEMFSLPNPDGRAGRLISLSGDGLTSVAPDRFVTQNGLAWSPDGTRMYVSDSFPGRAAIYVYDYDQISGAMTNRQIVIAGADMPGRPDGAAMDVDGCYWSASNDAGKLLRITPDGRIDATIEVPAAHVTNLCFAGPDLRTIYTTSISREGHGGQVFVIEDTPWQGLPDVPFRGTLPI